MRMRYRIRFNSLATDQYLDRSGRWTDWASAATFTSQAAAARFAEAAGIAVYGIF